MNARISSALENKFSLIHKTEPGSVDYKELKVLAYYSASFFRLPHLFFSLVTLIEESESIIMEEVEK